MSEHVLAQLAGIVVLGVAAQWLAWQFRLPSILILLLAGLIAGPGTGWLADRGWFFEGQLLQPDYLFGELLLPAVSLAVALILFEGGLTLNVRELRPVGGVIWRLVTVGAMVTWVVTTLAGHFIVGLDIPLAVLVGAVLVVTGPTVIGPLLRHVRPIGSVGPVLKWEGIVIDPVGAMLAVVVFEIIATGPMTTPAIAMIALKTLTLGTAAGLVAAGTLILLLRRRLIADHLQSTMTLALVIAAFAGANALQHESGLFAVTVMGLVLSNQRRVDVRHIMEFKETLTVLLISILFIVLGARLDQSQVLAAVNWRAMVFVAVLIVLARPLAVALCTMRSNLSLRERAFVAAMAPRGVVAAAVASVFALRLDATGYPGFEQIVPLTFATIFGTVTIYGLSARWVARRLELSRPAKLGFLIAGADLVAQRIAEFLQREHFEVLLADTNRDHVRAARLAGLPTLHESILSHDVQERVELTSIGRLLALTPNTEVNSLAALQFAPLFSRENVYQFAPEPPKTARQKESPPALRGRILFGKDVTHARLMRLLNEGATIKKTLMTREFNYEQFRGVYGDNAVPLMLMDESGGVHLVTAEKPPAPKAGQSLISVVVGAPAPAIERAKESSPAQ